jgi:hypothetical protein
MLWTKKMGGEEAGGEWQRATAAYGSSWPWRRPGRPPVAAMAACLSPPWTAITAVAAAVAAGHSPSCQLIAAVSHHGVHGRVGVGLQVAARVWEEVIGRRGRKKIGGERHGRGLDEASGRMGGHPPRLPHWPCSANARPEGKIVPSL